MPFPQATGDRMDIDLSDTDLPPTPRLKKFRLAGYGFLFFNLLYLLLAWIFLPPFHLGLSTLLSVLTVVALAVILTVYLCRGRKRLAQVLAVIYGARSLFTAYTLIGGETFMGVPYFLPCLLATFYLLGRAGWDWP